MAVNLVQIILPVVFNFITSTKNKPKEKDAEIKEAAFEERTLQKVERFEKAFYEVCENASRLHLPKPGEIVNLITNKSINQIAFIDRIHHEEGIDTLVSFIFSISEPAEKRLMQYIQECSRIILVYSVLKTEVMGSRESFFRNVLSQIKSDKLTIKRAYSHAKITACKTLQGNHYILNGSGNFTANQRIENYSIVNSEELFNAMVDYILTYKLD